MLHSIVLSIHREGDILLSTLRSLSRAAAFASDYCFELIAVLDKSDQLTRSVINDYNFSAFRSVRILSADFGSAGLTRNYGVENASGEFVFFADADDLISYNYFDRTIDECNKDADKNNVYCHEYLVEFGDLNSIVKYHDQPVVSALMFFKWFPFTSRMAAYKDTFLKIPSVSIPLGNFYAFEDYHHATKLIAAGYRFRVVRDTVLFYRRIEKKGLLNSMLDTSLNIIPTCPYFNADIYTNLCKEDYTRYKFGGIPEDPDVNLEKEQICKNLKDFHYDANQIEPLINKDGHVWGILQNNLNNFDLEESLLYYEICDISGGATFDHIFLMHFIAIGGAEKYILSIMHELSRQDPSCHMLVITGENYEGPTWEEKLPINAIHIDLSILERKKDMKTRYLLTLRIVEATARSDCNIHILSSLYSYGFLEVYRPILNRWNFVFYYFCDHHYFEKGKVKLGDVFHAIEKNASICSLIVSDNVSILERKKKLKHENDKLISTRGRCLRIPVKITNDAFSSPLNRDPYIFWASRIDSQKRPQIVPIVGKFISDSRPDKKLHVYGYSAFDYQLMNTIKNCNDVKYCGCFNEIASIPSRVSDILVYTSYVDGLPNTVLEAVAAGMLVIAPDVGSIHEIIRDNETGILLHSFEDDIDMAKAYAKAILTLLNNHIERVRLVKNAQTLLKRQHSLKCFSKSVSDIFTIKR